MLEHLPIVLPIGNTKNRPILNELPKALVADNIYLSLTPEDLVAASGANMQAFTDIVY